MNGCISKLRQYGLCRFIQFSLAELKLKLYYQLFLGSYSQCQEDLILDRLVHHKRQGFYVDIGACDPIRFNNTTRFYKRGWHGINIEPGVSQWKEIIAKRPKDINLNIGVGLKKDSLTYYSIDPPTLSTFQQNQAHAHIKQGFHILEKVRVPVLPLKNIFQKYVKKKYIDFISIDVEGMEMQVLASNDWKIFRPYFICIESADYSKTNEGRDNCEHIGTFLKKVGYVKVFDNGLNSFYKDTHHG